MNNITILVNSCDDYSDAWPPFFTLFKRFWPNCEYPILLNTETKKFDTEGLNIRTINSSKSLSYSERLLQALKEVKTPLVLILLEDFFIRNYVDINRIKMCQNALLQDDSIAMFSFESVEDKLNIISEKFPSFVLRPNYGEYKFNLQAGLWRTTTFKKFIKKNESPWELENNGNIRTFSKKLKFYALNNSSDRVIDYRINDGQYPFKWGIYRGKWVLDTVESLFQENDIKVDFSLRGIYTENSNEVFSNTAKKQTNNRVTAKAIGFSMWTKIYFWGYYRKIFMIFFRKKLPCSFLEYKRIKAFNKQIREKRYESNSFHSNL